MKTALASIVVLCSAYVINAAIVLPGDPAWGSENSGGGSSTITGVAPRSGSGSLELTGDRTRFYGLGNPYSAASNLGLLSSVTSFTFDWSIAAGSSNPYNPDYTPALRLHIWDGAQRSELIWEGAYNGAYGSTTEGVWYTSGNNDKLWQFQTGIGATEIYDRSLTDWQGIYSPGAYVAAISVGVGSGASSGYHAFADNVTLGIGGATTTYNFEAAAAVPEPSTYAAGLLVLGMLAAGWRHGAR